jgi:predicted dehydrogenase
MTIRLGFTGTGFSRVHAQAAQQLPGAAFHAIVNHRPESMQQFAEAYNIPHQYQTVEELLAAGGIDALIVTTPNYLHAAQTIAALQAGIHVMVEKPMAMNADEAREMVAAAEKSGALLMVAHCFRFDPQVAWLQNQLQAGAIGQPIRTRGYSIHANWGPEGWFTQAKYAGGGAMADMGIHSIDTTRFLLGDPQPRRVFARIGTYYGSYDVDDTGILVIDWDNGATSYIEFGWRQPHRDGPNAAIQVYGSAGFAQTFPTQIKTTDPETGDEVAQGYPGPLMEGDPHREKYAHQMVYFLDCLKKNEQPVPGGLEGWINMQIVDAAYTSAKTGQVVDVSV